MLSGLWLALSLVGCGEPPADVVRADSVGAERPAVAALRWSDGIELLAPELAVRDGRLHVSAVLDGATEETSLTIEALEAGGSDVVGSWRVVAPGSPGPHRISVSLPWPDRREKPHWVFAHRPGVAAEPFRGGRVSIGTVGAQVAPMPPAVKPEGRLAMGGDVNLGRRMNSMIASGQAKLRVPQLAEADLAYVNLECVVSGRGAPNVAKPERSPHFYRARPEVLAFLTDAGVDGVGAANNHSMDYGLEALGDQRTLLTAANLGEAGEGVNREAACEPLVRDVGGVRVALIAFDTTSPFAAADSGPGICFVDPNRPAAARSWMAAMTSKLGERADVVIASPHWGMNRKSRPTQTTKMLAHALLDGGADAVFGASAHMLQGVETYRRKPIVYDMGNLLFDSVDGGESTRGAVFTVELHGSGITAIRAHPLDVGMGRTTPAEGNSAYRTLTRLRDLSAELGTSSEILDNEVVFRFAGSNAPKPSREPLVVEPTRGLPPAAEPPPGCIDSGFEPSGKPLARWGAFTLLDATLSPKVAQGRESIWVDTWWKVEGEPPERLIEVSGIHEGGDPKTEFRSDHQGCDWGWPTARWESGTIYRDRHAVRTRPTFPVGTYEIRVGIGGQSVPLSLLNDGI